MSEWITGRKPTDDDAYYVTSTEGIVWITRGHDVEVELYHKVAIGTPWRPITAPEPYVKLKRYKVVQFENAEWGVLRIADDEYVAHNIPWNAREAAERIAVIYEEILP